MSRPPLLITNLKPDLNVWKIVVCVIDVWIAKERNGNQHVEAILQDVKTNEDHPLMYHAHLDNLLEKHFAFRVKFQPYYKQAFIMKLTQDPEVMRTTEDAITPTINIACVSAVQNWSLDASLNNTPSKRYPEMSLMKNQDLQISCLLSYLLQRIQGPRGQGIPKQNDRHIFY
ncbi:hypothetical protein KIW84_073244 [Lathyrus oleraceus]|uniref:Uncharacterized protein n=1 Tax=Pisum sativum TaxID=3888 RepID=A0A9D4VPH6_PEA|nr:hypothetical protein KIW84_073244 [Pisum sativum]